MTPDTPVIREDAMNRTKLQVIAAETLREHGMHIVAALKRDGERSEGGGYGAMNLIALMEIFAAKILPPQQTEQRK